MPVQIQRRLAAAEDVVYCTPGYTAPISVFDAATGRVLKTHKQTARTMEFVHDRGVLYAVTGDQYDISPTHEDLAKSALKSSLFRRGAYGPTIQQSDNPRNEILAVKADSGEELWRLPAAAMKGYEGGSIGVIGDRVVFSTRTHLVCLDRATGKARWRIPAPIVLKGPAGIAVSLVLSDRAAYLADSQKLRAFRLTDGKAMWEAPATINHHKPPDVFLADGLVWAQAYSGSTGKPAPSLGLTRMGVSGFDPETGKRVRKIDQTMFGPMGHDRCYRNRITTRYYINTVTGGSDFLNLASSTELPNPWIRSTCGIGPLPCNGLYYVGPPSCACCNSVMLNGMNALAAEPGLTRTDQPIRVAEKPTLQKGPAFGKITDREPLPAAPDDWPTYRHDNARTGSTRCKVPARVTQRWETQLNTRASAPVVAAGKVFVAEVDGHAVCALDVQDGKIAWRFTCEGRVDSPPTYAQGLVLFGSRDGTAYCLRAGDGELVWRFRPLPPRVICAYEQPESAWPICGSILIRNGLAYLAAGRNSFTDGGIFLYALDPRSGEVVHRRRMYGPFGQNGFPVENRQIVKGMSIEGFKNDVFLADEKLVYLRHQAFEADLSPVALADVKQPHLIPSHGFLEAIPQHRSFWTIDTMLHYDIPTGLGGIHGDILAIDGKRFYEVRGYSPGRTAFFDPRAKGYTLFAGTYGGPPEKAAAAAGGKETPRARRKSGAAAKKPAKTGAAQRAAARKRRARNRGPSNVAPSKELWASPIPLTGKAIVLAGEVVFVAGTPVAFPKDDLAKAYEGRMGGMLWAASAATGEKLAQYKLNVAPAWDSLAAANGLLFLALTDGRVVCMGP